MASRLVALVEHPAQESADDTRVDVTTRRTIGTARRSRPAEIVPGD
jgi:hypothetical protein